MRNPSHAAALDLRRLALLGSALLVLSLLAATVCRAQETAVDDLATATFAGGCFWCMEGPFDAVDGVVSTVSGYTGGHVENPTYRQVTTGTTGHYESIQVTFDPRRVSYEELLRVFWHNVDPTDDGGQFCDRGSSYRTAIFVLGDEQRRLAEQSKTRLEAAGAVPGPIVTPILDATAFYPAEEYHQDFYQKSPVRYRSYRLGCGRDRRLAELWGDEAGH